MTPDARPFAEGPGPEPVVLLRRDVLARLEPPRSWRADLDSIAAPTPDAWTPIAEGPERDACLEVIAAIAADLWPSVLATEGAHSLGNGEAGIALFYAYLAAAGLDDEAEARASELVGRSLAGLGGSGEASLVGEVIGPAWVLTHLVDLSEDDPADAVDGELSRMLAGSLPISENGLLRGLAGIGVYALDRLPRPAANQCVEFVVRSLGERAERHPEGITWFTPPELVPGKSSLQDGRIVSVPPPPEDAFPDGYYDVGMIRGQAGIVGFLARASCVDGLRTIARALLEPATAWLLAQRLPPDAAASFPLQVDPAGERRPGRFNWGRGDPGIAFALLAAARATGHQEWEDAALAALRAGARRPAREHQPRIAHLLVGAAGAAHVYNRLYHDTGDMLFASAARSWLEVTVELLPEVRFGALGGAAGVGLALLAAATEVEPAWDRLLLLSE